MNTVWHILIVKPSKVLPAHAYLVKKGFTVWTPFERVHKELTTKQKNAGITRRTECVAKFGSHGIGFMFIGLDADAYGRQALALRKITDKSNDIHDVILSAVESESGPQWYSLPQYDMDALISLHGKGYDHTKDKDRPKPRDFDGLAEIPTFTPSQIVQFLEGPMRGIEFEVLGVDGANLLLDGGGWLGKVEASAFDLIAGV